MAHPLTQHPPSALAFNSAPRPSPLGFGFGVPGSSSGPLGFGQPKSPGFGGSLQSFGFGQNTPSSSFGQSGNNGSPSPSTSRRPSIRTAPYPSPLGPRSTGLAAGTPSQSLKRQRKSPSPTPSSSPSPSSSAPSPHFRSSELPLSREKEDLSVGNLALKDGFGRHVSARKDVKRVKQDPSAKPTSASGGSDVDVGLLLAALPASAHLPILRSLLQSHPSLNAEVLSRIPRPEHGECSAQLDRLVDKVKKKYGPTGAGLNPDRAWDRALKDVDAFCRTASTYINYLVQPQSSASDYDLQAVQTLLFTLSIHIYTLLRLVPANTDMSHGTVTHSLLELGKSLVNHWSNWLGKLAAEVNQRGGMFPSSTVEVWANNLDTLASSSRPQSTFSPFPSNPFQTANNEPEHQLVTSFRSALVPLRDRFASELGWLIGRRPAFTNQTSFQAPFLSPSYSPASAWSQRAISAGTGEDEEL